MKAVRRWLGLGVLAWGLVACEAPLAPYTTDGPVFALDGVLQATADTQRVRIQLLSLRAGAPPSLDVALRSEGPDGPLDWDVALAEDAEGTPIVVAEAPLRVLPNATYRLTATADRGTTVAEVTLPDTFAVDASGAVVSADTSVVDQELRLAQAPTSVDEVTVRYVVRASAAATSVSFTRTYPAQSTSGGRLVRVDLAADLGEARRLTLALPNDTLLVEATTLRYRLRVLGTVTDGFGSLGAEADYAAPWAIADSLLPYLRATRL